MKSRLFITLCILSFCILSSCKKCKECYIVEGEGTASEQTINLGEKCGDELEELEALANLELTGNDASVRTYCN